jgi:hypothetical protein
MDFSPPGTIRETEEYDVDRRDADRARVEDFA